MAEWSDIVVSSYVLRKGADIMASQYVSYTVQSKSAGQRHTVERRFNDFILLQREIAKEFPGAIIAPLPKDQVFGRFKPAFIESRMRGLEECLKKTYSDQDMSKSCCWTPFFSSPNFNAASLVLDKGISGAPALSSKSVSWNSLKKLAAPVLVNPYLDTADMDDKMNEVEMYISLHSKSMQVLLSTAEGLAEKTNSQADIFKSFSEVCTAIGSNCEDADDEFIRQFGLSVDSLSANALSTAESQLLTVKEPLEQQTRTLLSISAALRRQKALKKDFIASAANKLLCEKAEQKDPANLNKIEASRASRGAVLTARQKYLDASSFLLDNFERVKNARCYQIIATAQALCELEIRACEADGHILADMLDELSYDEDES